MNLIVIRTKGFKNVITTLKTHLISLSILHIRRNEECYYKFLSCNQRSFYQYVVESLILSSNEISSEKEREEETIKGIHDGFGNS